MCIEEFSTNLSNSEMIRQIVKRSYDKLKEMYASMIQFAIIRRSVFSKAEEHGILNNIQVKHLTVLTIFSLYIIIESGEASIMYLYLRRSPLSFNHAQYSVFKSIKNLVIGLGLLLPINRRKTNAFNRLCLGVITIMLCEITYIVHYSKECIYLVSIFSIFVGYPSVELRTILATMFKAKDGKSSIVYIVELISALVGFITFTAFYANHNDYYPWTLFAFGWSLHFFIMLLLIFIFDRNIESVRQPQFAADFNTNALSNFESLHTATLIELQINRSIIAVLNDILKRNTSRQHEKRHVIRAIYDEPYLQADSIYAISLDVDN
ncbi:hypothetical protein GJ496_010368 [Pomphorhynchus laevis]|nr:hypothetical protein GJ496_010368 [Pomphorhynchus laevis]